MGDYSPSVAAGYKYDGSTGVNQSQFLRTGHTAANPRVVIFKREPLRTNGTHSVSIRAVQAVPTSYTPIEGEPTNALIDVTIRNVRGQTDADIKTLLGLISDILGDADFQDDAVTENRIPRETVA